MFDFNSIRHLMNIRSNVWWVARLAIRRFLGFCEIEDWLVCENVCAGSFRWAAACSFSILVGAYTRVFTLRWSRFLGRFSHASVQPVGTNWKGWRLFAKEFTVPWPLMSNADFHDLDAASLIDFFPRKSNASLSTRFSIVFVFAAKKLKLDRNWKSSNVRDESSVWQFENIYNINLLLNYKFIVIRNEYEIVNIVLNNKKIKHKIIILLKK